MTDVVYPNIKPVVTQDGAESYLSVRNVVSFVVVVLFVVAMAWLYYKLLDKDRKIQDLETGLINARKSKEKDSSPPDDIESQVAPTKPVMSKKAPPPQQQQQAESPKPIEAPKPAAHIAIVEGEDDKEIEKYL